MTDKRYFALIGEDGYVYPVFFDSENEDKEIDVDVVVDLLNENEQLKHDATVLIQANQEYRKENEQLKKAIVETEKMVQSTYDELTKLRCFKKNILRIKHSWDYLMEAIQYD